LNPKISKTSQLVEVWLLHYLQCSTAFVSVSVKDIRIESFVSGLLFVEIDSEIQKEGWCRGEGNRIVRYDEM
jgi:hypothetical protein